jgi:hypothetical protein
VSEIDIPGRDTFGAVRRHLDAIEVNAGAIEDELCPHVRPHRPVALNRHEPVREHGGAVVARPVGDAQIKVRRDDAPRRFVIVIGELAAARTQVLQGRRKSPRAVRIVVVGRELRKVVRVFPFFDEHAPVGHLDRRDHEFRSPPDRVRPVEADRDAFRGEERPIARLHPVDPHVLGQHAPAEHVNRQPPDMHRPFDLLRELPLAELAHVRAQIDRDRGDDSACQNGDRERQRQRHVPDDRMIAEL